MNTDQIQRILDSDICVSRIGAKVLACDQLPTYIDRSRRAAFVINTDPSDMPGSHWVGLYYDAAYRFEYFDSFGLQPVHAQIVSFIRRNSNRPLLFNSRHLQDTVSAVCGLYCIYFLLVKCRGGSMQRVLYPFSSSTRQWQNDRIIYRLLRPRLTCPDTFYDDDIIG